MILSFKDFLSEQKQLLLMGGNVVLNGIPAERVDLKKLSRTEVVNSLRIGLNAINDAFAKYAGFPLWSSDLFTSGDFLSGSAKWFFDLTSIDDERFKKVKSSVGDVDLQVDGAAQKIIEAFLNSLGTGTKLGTLEYIGNKYSADQYITLWSTDFGQTVQIDFELVEYAGGKPTPWSTFSHSSAWEDLELGIKGAFAKFYMRALTARSTKDIILLKGKKQVPTKTQSTEYVASLKGIRTRLQPVMDGDVHRHLDGLPVYTELPSAGAKYFTDMDVFFSILFDAQPTDADLKDVNSFVGMINITKKYIKDRSEQQKIVDRFAEILFGAGAQGIYRGREGRLLDFRDKTVALRYICKELGLKWDQYLPMIRSYYRSYK